MAIITEKIESRKNRALCSKVTNKNRGEIEREREKERKNPIFLSFLLYFSFPFFVDGAVEPGETFQAGFHDSSLGRERKGR